MSQLENADAPASQPSHTFTVVEVADIAPLFNSVLELNIEYRFPPATVERIQKFQLVLRDAKLTPPPLRAYLK